MEEGSFVGKIWIWKALGASLENFRGSAELDSKFRAGQGSIY
jgi:hypothetical protein